MASFFEQILAILIVLGIFFQIISKVVRLASKTWDEREHLETNRIIQLTFVIPILLILLLIGVYYGVLFLIQIVVL
ncbi:MAG: hypothetical protein HeimC2_04850 [Candidatus Heimdallarchaeota archaeon LC_2]|nr:MAG: hypothetical protein HeimC2_04850 [Candidatus Heimdallarchaeota archaeon LC_2]